MTDLMTFRRYRIILHRRKQVRIRITREDGTWGWQREYKWCPIPLDKLYKTYEDAYRDIPATGRYNIQSVMIIPRYVESAN